MFFITAICSVLFQQQRHRKWLTLTQLTLEYMFTMMSIQRSKMNEYKRIKSSWVDTGGFEHWSLFGLHRDSCRPWSESSWRSGQFLLDACHAAAIVTYSPWQKGGAETMRVGDRSLNFKHHVPGNFLRSRCASFPQGRALFAEHISSCLSWSRWWFQIVIIFTPIWGRFPFWLIFFRWVETTNQ